MQVGLSYEDVVQLATLLGIDATALIEEQREIAADLSEARPTSPPPSSNWRQPTMGSDQPIRGSSHQPTFGSRATTSSHRSHPYPMSSSGDQRVYAPRPTNEEKSVIVVTIPKQLVQAAHEDLHHLPRTVQAMVAMVAQPPIIRPHGSRYVHGSVEAARENNRYVEWQRTLMVHLLETLPPSLAELVFGMYGTACEEITHQGAACLTEGSLLHFGRAGSTDSPCAEYCRSVLLWLDQMMVRLCTQQKM